MTNSRKHGFSTKEEWYQLFSDYFEKIRKLDMLASSFHMENNDIWIQEYKQKSKLLRSMYLQDSDRIYPHVGYFLENPKEWSKEIADPLLSYLYRYSTRFEDIEAAYHLTVSLYHFYKEQENETAIMKCYLILILCYVYLDIVHFRNKILYLCEAGEDLFIRHYKELDEEERSLGIGFYDVESVIYSEIVQINVPVDEYFDTVLRSHFEKNQKVINQFMEEENLKLPINAVIPEMKQAWINSFTSIILHVNMEELREDQLQYVRHYVQKELDRNAEHELPVARIVICRTICLMIDHRFLKLDDNAVMKQLTMFEKMLPHEKMDTFETYDDEVFNAFQTLALSIGQLAPKHKEYCKVIEHFIWRLHDIIVSFHGSNYLEQVADASIYFYIAPLLKYLSGKTALHMLLSLTVFRQPQTAIHTVMVSKIASCLLSGLIEDQPLLFKVNQWGYDTATQIITHKEDFMTYIINGALLHDVGKVLCTAVINMQYRKLMHLEYETIMFHPLTSGEILSKIPALSCYKDIAMGHHKSYDDKHGYPEEFSIQDSPYKIFIDLVSISDSLDAATDQLGRNYTHPKTFDEILEELDSMKGTRYNDKIIDWIKGNESVKEELRELLGAGRETTYKTVSRIIEKNKKDIGKDHFENS